MNRINGRQATCLLLVVLGGWSLTMTAENGRDGWIALALACALSLPLGQAFSGIFGTGTQTGPP